MLLRWHINLLLICIVWNGSLSDFYNFYVTDNSQWRLCRFIQRIYTCVATHGTMEYNIFHILWTAKKILLIHLLMSLLYVHQRCNWSIRLFICTVMNLGITRSGFEWCQQYFCPITFRCMYALLNGKLMNVDFNCFHVIFELIDFVFPNTWFEYLKQYCLASNWNQF